LPGCGAAGAPAGIVNVVVSHRFVYCALVPRYASPGDICYYTSGFLLSITMALASRTLPTNYISTSINFSFKIGVYR
jgi:hypothetical protein